MEASGASAVQPGPLPKREVLLPIPSVGALVARKKVQNHQKKMRQSLTEFFDSKDRDWYRRGIAKLEEQWQKVIESGGEYFDY